MCLCPNFDLACQYVPVSTCECNCMGNKKTLLSTGYFCVHTDIAHFCYSFPFLFMQTSTELQFMR